MNAIDNGPALKAARLALGLTCAGLADRLRLNGAHAKDAVREIEEGKRPLTGPIAVAVELLLYSRELELELGVNDERNAAIARAAGKAVNALKAPTGGRRQFDPRGLK